MLEQAQVAEARRAHCADTPLLAIEGLTRRFGKRVVVESLDLSLEAGDRVALCGPNGSGKTTILRCIAGTLLPTDGQIHVNGLPAGSIAARYQIGASLSQDRSFYLRLSGRANLLFFARLRSPSEREARAAVRAIEAELELAFAGERVNRYSSGMLQQLGFARALLGDPPLLLLDEPTRSLDIEARERLWRAIDRRSQSGVLIATHNEEDLARCGARVDLTT
jgi:ABC-type multidrug transport system ATPase subunit